VVAVGVKRTARGGTGWAGDTPANRGGGGGIAADCRAERVRCAEFDADGAGGERDGYIAGDGQRCGGEFRWVAVAGGGDLHRGGDRQVGRGSVEAGRGNGAGGGAASSDGVDVPGDGGVCCAGDAGGESLRVA